jgi:predicted secreted protein
VIAGVSSDTALASAAPGTATPPAGTPAAGADPAPALDVTADTPPDMTVRLAEALSRNAVMLLLAQQTEQQKLQLRLDRIKAHFNASQEERAEMLREMNALRDMALEQSKKDDEVLKKYIAMI